MSEARIEPVADKIMAAMVLGFSWATESLKEEAIAAGDENRAFIYADMERRWEEMKDAYSHLLD